jgi:putative oxidoreductase
MVIMNLAPIAAAWQPRLLGLLRIVTALLLLQHGMAKLFGFPHVAMFDNLRLLSLVGIAGVLELAGGVLLLLGIFTRPVAFILSGEMAFAYYIAHAQKSFFPILNQGGACGPLLLCPPLSRRGRRRRVEFYARQGYAAFHLIEQPIDGT